MVTVLLIDRLGRRAAMAIEFALLTASVSLTISLSLQLQSKLKKRNGMDQRVFRVWIKYRWLCLKVKTNLSAL